MSRVDAAALRNGNALFAGRMLALMAGTQPNVALSPASISEALSMAFAGARGTTAAQIAGALHFGLPPARWPRPSTPPISRSPTSTGPT